MLLVVALSLFAPLAWAFNATNSAGYPVCSENIYLANGQIDLDSTLYNCSANINGALIIPSYVPKPSGAYEPVNMSIQIKVNELISVDDITSSVTMGFFLRLQWYDERWYLPELFETLTPQAAADGLDITPYINSQNPLNIWLPDIVFYEATAIDPISEFIRLFPDGKLFWSRNMVVSLQESQNQIFDYPNDDQKFSLTFQSYSFETLFLKLQWMDPSVVFRYNTEYHRNAVELNQLWSFEGFHSWVENVASPAVFNPNRQYSSANVDLVFKRQSFGVIFRLALPVCMFMLIVGFSFWTDVDKRLELTVEMLLTITALYLIIGTVIPFVGYLTVMDQFMSCIFVLLSLVIGVHVICIKLHDAEEEHPMSRFYGDCIVLFFRVVWLPCTIAVFQFYFQVGVVVVQLAFYSTCIACAAQLLFSYEMMEESFRVSIINLRKLKEEVKVEQSKLDSGKLKGHDIHLVRELEYTERIIYYLTKPLYKNKTPRELQLEHLEELQQQQQNGGSGTPIALLPIEEEPVHDEEEPQQQREEEEREASEVVDDEEVKEDAAEAAATTGIELSQYNGSVNEYGSQHYLAPVVSRHNSGSSQQQHQQQPSYLSRHSSAGSGVPDAAENNNGFRSFGSQYLMNSVAGNSQRESLRQSQYNLSNGARVSSPYAEASYYNSGGQSSNVYSRANSPARYPSGYGANGGSPAGSRRYGDRHTNSAYGGSYYEYGGRGNGGY